MKISDLIPPFLERKYPRTRHVQIIGYNTEYNDTKLHQITKVGWDLGLSKSPRVKQRKRIPGN